MSLLSRIVKAQSYQQSGMEVRKPTPYQEMGVSGLQRTKGTASIVFEEIFSGLSGYRQRQVYREMRDNDAAVGSMFFAIEMILRRAEWDVEAANASAEAEGYAKFVDECIDDLSHPFEDFMSECAAPMLTYGFSLFETPYKRRLGPQTSKPSSKFNDGLIGWQNFEPRAQESILYWAWDDEEGGSGELIGATQLAAPDYITTTIPMESLLLFRTTSTKNNPEGRSVLRSVYRSWSAKKRLEEVIQIGIERDVCGLPVLYASAEAITAMGGGNYAAGYELAKRFITNIRQDDQDGIILPQAFDERGNRQVELVLMKSAGPKQTDPEAALKRLTQEMLNTILAGFIELGQTEHGARSLHMSATQIFAEAISAWLDGIEAVLNRHAIPRLMSINSMDLSLAPRLKHGEIGVRDLEEVANYVMKLSQAGIPFFDKDTASWFRKLAKMPEEPGNDVAVLDEGLDAPDAPAPGKKGKKQPKGAQQQDPAAADRLQAAV